MADILEHSVYVRNILLVENSFKRAPNVSADGLNVHNDLKINAQHTVYNEGKAIQVTLDLNYTSRFKETNEVELEAFIRYVGIFETATQFPVDTEVFGKINGPAIIFPYIREHFTCLSSKAGINQMIIPTVNFAENAKQQEQKKE